MPAASGGGDVPLQKNCPRHVGRNDRSRGETPNVGLCVMDPTTRPNEDSTEPLGCRPPHNAVECTAPRRRRPRGLPARRWARNFPRWVDRHRRLLLAGVGLLYAAGILLLRRRLLWGLLVGFFLLQWLLFLPDVRYFLPILPLLIYAWWRAARWTLAVVPGRAGASVAIVMIGLWVAMNAGRTVGVVIDQRRVPFTEHHENGRYAGIEEPGFFLKTRI